jgi:chemotaxis protein MotB
VSDDDEPKFPHSTSVPGWVVTFADLMTLLMCFFVLLLSYSEMDAQKFRRMAGSMAKALGVQAEINAFEIPKGTSILAQEFSPGVPEPTPINEIWQKTSNEQKSSLDTQCPPPSVDQSEADAEAQRRIKEQLTKLVQETEFAKKALSVPALPS